MSTTLAVLCIDDNVLGLAVRKGLLESRDYRVFTADNGMTGIEIACRELIDLVILDYEMPEMDGGQVARQLRTQCPGLPILLLTGYPGRIPQSLLGDVDGLVIKGSSPEILLKEVKRITSSSADLVPMPKPPVRRRQTKEAGGVPAGSRQPLRSCRQKRKRR